MIWKESGGQNFKLQHALGGGDLGHHLLQRLVHLAGLGGDGDTGAAVGGNGLVDGQYICPGIGKIDSMLDSAPGVSFKRV